MSYKYEDHRDKLFTDAGQREFLKVRDRVNGLIESAGAVRMDMATQGCSGDSWIAMAYVDRMVELKELVEVTPAHQMGQYRIFTRYNMGG